MMNFDDRDLVQLAQTAGLDEVHVECHIDIGPGSVLRPIDLQGLLDTAPNPTAPTIRQGIDAALTTAEREQFLARLQQAVNDRDAVHRTAVAHVFATKFSEDIKRIDIPTLILHGTADRILPTDGQGRRLHAALPDAHYVEIDGGPHVMCVTHAKEVNRELIAFLAQTSPIHGVTA
jgi:pimeloyl-ACP methyl ester carboxylesterase